MKTVVGYGRYSSDAQKECSIEIQKNFIEKFCHTHDLKLDKFFADYAKRMGCMLFFDQALMFVPSGRWEVCRGGC